MTKVFALFILTLVLSVIAPLTALSVSSSANIKKTGKPLSIAEAMKRNQRKAELRSLAEQEKKRKDLLSFIQIKIGLSSHLLFRGEEDQRRANNLLQPLNGFLIKSNTNRFSNYFSIKTSKQIVSEERALLPVLNIGINKHRGRHRFSFETRFFSMLPINSLTIRTDAKLTENKICSGPDYSACGFAKLGFVDKQTGSAIYQLDAVMNESYWIYSFIIGYSYSLFKFNYLSIEPGFSLGYTLLSRRQDIQFNMSRENTGLKTLAGYILTSSPLNHGRSLELFINLPLGSLEKKNLYLKIGAGLNIIYMDVKTSGSITALLDAREISSFTLNDNPQIETYTYTMQALSFYVEGGVTF